MQEDAFRNFMAATLASRSGERRLRDRSTRAFERPQAAGMRADFFSRLRPLPHGGGDVSCRYSATACTLAKLAKGVAYVKSGAVILPSKVRWMLKTIPRDEAPGLGGASETLDVPSVPFRASYSKASGAHAG
jgi:hypothetical protein